MEKFIIFFILIGIFNVLSKIMQKKLDQAQDKQMPQKKEKKPYFTLEEVPSRPKVHKAQKEFKIDDLFRSIDEAAGIVSKKQDFEIKAKPVIVPPLSIKQEVETVSLPKMEQALVIESLPVDEKLNQEIKTMASPVIVTTERKASGLPAFAKNPVINGIIWSEILKRPRYY